MVIRLVIIGGIKRIGMVTSRLVPVMSIIYFLGAITVLMLNARLVPEAVVTIFREAFTPSAGVGGFFGSTFMFTLIWGVKRGIFSNEAGQGSAPIAHAAAKTGEPVREGLVAMVGPYIDTLLICTLTGLVIVTVGVWKENLLVHAVRQHVQESGLYVFSNQRHGYHNSNKREPELNMTLTCSPRRANSASSSYGHPDAENNSTHDGREPEISSHHRGFGAYLHYLYYGEAQQPHKNPGDDSRGRLGIS